MGREKGTNTESQVKSTEFGEIVPAQTSRRAGAAVGRMGWTGW